jgi:hypothetical protein
MTHAAELQKPSRLPVLMSAFGFPGVGQFMQRRWLAGTFFVITFSASLIVFLASAFRIIYTFYALGFGAAPEPTLPQLPLRPALAAFFAALLLYITAVMDAQIAYLRACRAWTARKHRTADFSPPPPPPPRYR